MATSIETPLNRAHSDALLRPFLEADTEPTADEWLRRIMEEHAEPIMAKIIKSKLHVSLNDRASELNQDGQDIAGDLRAAIIASLRALRAETGAKPIVSFADFVAVKAYSACADYFREKNPRRRRLKDMLRLHLKNNPEFTLSEGDDRRWYAGFSQIYHPGEFSAHVRPASHLSGADIGDAGSAPAEFLSALLMRAGGLIEFDEVVRIAAEVWGIHDEPGESIDRWDTDKSRNFVSPLPGVDIVHEQRQFLDNVWKEVGELPILQRVALLLNLKDSKGGGVIWFLPLLGIATKDELAQLLGMSNDDFQALWTELPCDDLRIAALLGITRQQVINLRKTARERIARRLRNSGKS